MSLKSLNQSTTNTSELANAGTAQPTLKYIGYVDAFVFIFYAYCPLASHFQY